MVKFECFRPSEVQPVFTPCRKFSVLVIKNTIATQSARTLIGKPKTCHTKLNGRNGKFNSSSLDRRCNEIEEKSISLEQPEGENQYQTEAYISHKRGDEKPGSP